MEQIQIDEIRLWHKTFKEEGELFEIRILGDKTYSAYFDDVEKAIIALSSNDFYNTQNIYYTINPILPACRSRKQYNNFIQVRGDATSKNDIERRRWIAIDVDAERPSGVSSTDEEKKKAHLKAVEVFKFLNNENITSIYVCDSSSGYHMMIPFNAENTKESEDAIKKFLETLSRLFTDNFVKIDKVLFDANRILRLEGSYGRKGLNTQERPHRLCKLLKSPEDVQSVTLEEIMAITAKYEVKFERKETPSYNRFNSNENFSLKEFIDKHGIKISKTISNADGVKYVLEECCFDHSHKSPDAALFELPNGAIAFKCFHDSCSSHTWQDVRLLYEPDAYNDPMPTPYNNKGYNKPAYNTPKKEAKIKEELPELGKKWFRMKDIPKVDLNSLVSLKTGFRELDFKIVGLTLGEVSLLSGSNSSGKSSWLNTLILNIVNSGHKVALWSGELIPGVLKTWIQMVAAGRNNLLESQKNLGKYYVNPSVVNRIDEWLDDKFFLYNNNYGARWQQIFNDMKTMVDYGVELLILDNLFSLDIDIFDGDKNNKQKELILQICSFAKKNNIHLILVCHPRKQTDFLRKDSISGTADLTNAADNVFIIHRVNMDFEKRGEEFFGKDKIFQYKRYGNVIEVAKNRMYGVVDHLCGMYYDIPSRRFMNEEDECMHYGWELPPTPVSIPMEEIQNHSFNGYQQDREEITDDIFKERDHVPF
jgi:hypothetical protein